jgi:hypothetical protein
MWCMSRRLSVTLEPEDEALVERFASSGTPENDALKAWATSQGLRAEQVTSDAALLRLLLRVGAESLQESILEVGYAALADSMTIDEHEETRAARRRYADRTDGHLDA